MAQPVLEIAKNPEKAYDYTNKGNLVAVITDGTAILGLGNRGPLAAKPVMEGKAVLFKQFAGIDVYDIEVNAKTPQDFIKVVEAIAPTFGGINLEDIAAPHCFEIEAALKKKLDIPVFHDDQHGTAIIICAGLINALHVQGKTLEDSQDRLPRRRCGRHRVAESAGGDGREKDQHHAGRLQGRGAQGTHRPQQLQEGLRAQNEIAHAGRRDGRRRRVRRRVGRQPGEPGDGEKHGRPAGGLRARQPQSRNPPEKARAARSDLVMATGRSDYPNQVNNVLGFPFIFRGALDARAKEITQDMLIAAVHALAELAREPVPASVLKAYKLKKLKFGPDYILPKPFDPRLAERVPQAVAKAAKKGMAAAKRR